MHVTLLARDRVFDRSKLMKRAAGARNKGKHKKAISLYRQVLEAEPESPEIHQKLAPLLARTRQAGEALASYRIAAEALVRQGFNEQAIGLLRGAAVQLPRETVVWQGLAELEMRRSRRIDAVEALLEGRQHMKARSDRAEAIALLSQARKLDPGDFRISYDLACLLGRTGRRARALSLLDELARRPDRRRLARVRARQLWLAPGFGSAGRYLRALVLRR
jgi:tetratricopeptide (TPR) repeat protein